MFCAPKMLCPRCSALTQQDPGVYWSFAHHASYADLKQSAADGCQLCNLLKQAIIVQFAHDLSSTMQEAEEYHLAQDRVDQYEQVWDRSMFRVSSCLVDLDPSHSSLHKGSHGLQVVRITSDDDAVPLREIYTTLSFQMLTDGISNGCIVGKALLPEPDIELAQQWISGCINNHKACGDSSRTPLPTRVLAVGPSDGSQHPRLETANGRTGRYAALSHRWGGCQPIALNEQTYKPFLNEIPFPTLPATFQDAVKVTRKLKIPFLWIDSLCIFQDSREDWANECIKMPDIYKYSEVNIASSSAINCDAGFLHLRTPPPIPPIELEWKSVHPSRAQKVHMLYHHPGTNSDPEPDERSTLGDRAWILQERILSPRTVYFGFAKMYFECRTNVSYENICFPMLDDYQSRNEVKKLELSASKSHHFWIQTWYQLITTYMGTNITFQNDRLPAVSGVARELSKVLEDEYIAGLWKSDLARGLTWYVPDYVTQQQPLDKKDPYIAPSWSWASVRAVISYESYVSDLDISKSQVQISSLSVNSKTSDTYGSVIVNSFVEIRGKMFEARTSPGRNRWVPERRAWYAYSETTEEELGHYYPDDVSLNDTALPVVGSGKENAAISAKKEGQRQVSFLYLGDFPSRVYKGQSMALAVERVDSDPTLCRRCGMLVMEISENMLSYTTVRMIRLI